MNRHIQITVATVLEMLEDKHRARRAELLFDMPASKIRVECQQLIQEGKLFIPTIGCDTDDPTGECKGHMGLDGNMMRICSVCQMPVWETLDTEHICEAMSFKKP